MPLTAKGQKILQEMIEEYGSKEKGEEVFYASKNAGKITGVDSDEDPYATLLDAVERLRERVDAMVR